MLPVYFLSIALNLIAGYILAFRKEETSSDGLFFSLDNETIRVVIGIFAFITGILKILSPVTVPGNIFLLGDLFPALAGIAGGFLLALQFYRSRESAESDSLERIAALTAFADKNKKLIGIVCIVSAPVHLFFYPILFL